MSGGPRSPIGLRLPGRLAKLPLIATNVRWTQEVSWTLLERAKRAENARQAFYLQMAMKSSEVRGKKKSAQESQ